MSLFKKIFGGSGTEVAATPVNGHTGTAQVKVGYPLKEVRFGRYTDCNKTKKQLDAWTDSLNHFKEKAYVNSFEALLTYIGDPALDNVKITRNGETVEFELIQGSKVVRGKGTANAFTAECPIIVMENPSIPVMRKLMGLNYGLLYTKFALKDNTLVMKFSSSAIDASPNKLYYALKELATKADQQDDLLKAEFSSLKTIDTDHVIQLPESEKEIKYNALISWIKDTKEKIAAFSDQNYMSGGIAYLLLNLSSKIDYLVCPQGSLTETFKKIQNMFFAQNDLSTLERNKQIMAEFDKIAALPKEQIYEGLYDVKSTFAIANPTAHSVVMDMMFNERSKVQWYKDNNYPQIVEAVYGYMIGYAFMNYGMVYPVTDILNLGMQVLNPDYYEKSGALPKLVNADKTLNADMIKKEIDRMIVRTWAEYPYVKLDVNLLNYTSATNFIDSLIVELNKFNLQRI